MTKNDMGGMEKDKKGEQNRRKQKREPLKISGITYGEKSLTACMEAVIRLHVGE